MIARAEVWLFHENEELFLRLAGNTRAVATMPRLHGQLIRANEAMVAGDDATSPTRKQVAAAVFVNSLKVIKGRNRAVHGAFVEGERDPTVAINLNSQSDQDAQWKAQRFDEVFDALRRAAIRTRALVDLFDPESGYPEAGLLRVARDHFVLYSNGSWMASTERAARTES